MQALTNDAGDGVIPPHPNRLNAKLSAISFSQVQLDEAPLLRRRHACSMIFLKEFIESTCRTKGALIFRELSQMPTDEDICRSCKGFRIRLCTGYNPTLN